MVIMLRTIVIIFLISNITFGRYHEKTRFDRSLAPEEELQILEEKYKEPIKYIDYTMRYVAYKDMRDMTCYLEKLRDDRWKLIMTGDLRPRVLYPSTLSLTNVEAWKMAGGRIVNFCEGNSIKLLQEARPIPADAQDPFLNEIPLDENDVIQKRIADVVLTPLLSRAKREIMLENREHMNQQFIRTPRQIYRNGGKFRGQTQSQYLNHGSEGTKEGKAEAEATDQSSRALVSGTNGMGQAQSMSSGGLGCEDCVNYSGSHGLTGVGIQSPVGISRGYPGYTSGVIPPTSESNIPGFHTNGVVPGSESGVTQTLYPPGGAFPRGVPGISSPGIPGSYPGGVQQSGSVAPGSIPGMPGAYIGGLQRPGSMVPGTMSGIPGVYHGGSQQPGSLIPGSNIGINGPYPGNVQQPGSVVPGINSVVPGSYPGGIQQPGSVIPGSNPSVSGSYPGSGQQPGSMIPGSTPGVPGSYLGGVQHPGSVIPSGIPGVPGSYPGGVQQPGSMIPGSTPSIPGSYPVGAQNPGSTIPGGIPGTPGSYPGGVQQPGPVIPSGIPGVPGSYPGGVQQPGSMIPGSTPGIPGSYPGGVQQPGSTIPGGIPGTPGSYPGGVQQPGSMIPGSTPGIQGTYPGGVQQPGSAIFGGIPGAPGSYPGGVQQPGSTIPGGIPGIPGSYPGGVPQTGSMIPGSTPGIQGTYPGGVQHPGSAIPGGVPGVPGSYPGGVQQPGSVIPGSIPGGSGSYPGSVQHPGSYPGSTQQTGSGIPNIPGVYYPGGIQQPGSTTPGNTPSIPGSYPGAVQQPGSNIPGQQQYPTSGPSIPGIYPGATVPNTVPGMFGIPPGTVGTPGSAGSYPGIYPGHQGLSVGGVPGSVYPGGNTPTTGYPFYPGNTAAETSGVIDDGADSHASSSVKQSDSGTQATASADGKFGTGTAQSQVSGVYTGSGSFAAQAGVNDGKKGAQSQVSGGKEGALSNAQGTGGQGKSQSQVQLNSETGATTTGAQSTGWNHGTNSQVQASAKGGMADAQANGEGSTSSQAQIGFQPYIGSKEKEKNRSKPFKGGGQASAQSGTYRGQSQSQIDGSFQFGITYTGAAQAGSGSGVGASRKPFNFSNSDSNIFKSFDKFDPITISKNDESTTVSPDLDISSTDEPNMKPASSSRKTIIAKPQNRQKEMIEPPRDNPSYDSEIAEYEDEEYEDEEYDASSPQQMGGDVIKTRSGGESSRQIQTINVGNDKKYNIHVIQDSARPRIGDILQPGHVLPGYTIPPGFRGRVASISGERTHAQGNGKSQSQTVSSVPSHQGRIQTEKLGNSDKRSLKNEHDRGSSTSGSTSGNHNSSDKTIHGGSTRSMDASPVKSNYFTVTKSVAGKLGDPRQKYEHRYYTKSSTCGYFTFSCNMVHGSNGRTKICKPKMPTYPDGTPMKC
ncbi:hypothetical protein PV328_001730 [Microctonus aethiopoides]|uniref:Uncharacterized protein n=1 Tax=Microctonus aethiopoides TaxID=144406 RepID=A0AA39FXL5_9HYME|nr:hypothetical protein PV328_001730 [Microctonus aethiopoides]